MTPWQRRLQLALVAVAVVAFAFTVTKATPSAGSPVAGQPSTSPAPTGSFDLTPRIAVVYDVGGSAGMNELVREGVERAADAFDAELEVIEVGPDETDADREAHLTELAGDRYYPILAIGSTYADAVARVAPKYPGTWFGIVDDGSVHEANVIGIQFNEAQGSFLVGAAAALTSKTDNVGFIGAVPTPEVEKYEAGFTAGARAADPQVTVQVAYLSQASDDAVGSDPADARKAAMEMYDAGADVIFGAVGDSSDAVIQAAHDRGRWAIGVDSDRYLEADPSVRDAILTSMLKRADAGAYTMTMEIANGIPKDGNHVFGLDRGGVGYSISGGFVDSITAQLDAFAARIAAGEIRVPRTPQPAP